MLTLIMCLFQNFIYIIKIYHTKKKTTKITTTKTRKNKKNKIIKHIKWKYIHFNLLKIELEIISNKQQFWSKWEEKKRKWKLWNEADEKMNWRGGRWDL
jgi:hypothetical protein